MYSYQVNGIEVKSAESRPSESLLYAALGIAATLAFQQARPVILCMNNQPYRCVSVDFIERPVPPLPALTPRK